MNPAFATGWADEPSPQVASTGNLSAAPLPAIKTLEESIAADLPEPQVLVEGLIHQGTKVSLAGGSKCYKTWMLLALAIGVGSGVPWLGHQTTPGKVLYINLELMEVFMRKRALKVCEALGLEKTPSISFWHLRGHACSADQIIPRIIEEIKDSNYSLIIVDPIYKLMGGREENAAGDVADLLNHLEVLCVFTGAAVVFGTHFSKGNQSGKEAQDRVSGSGVFSRDPDTIITLTQHSEEDAFTMDAILRNFPKLKSKVVRWQDPLVMPADHLDPKMLKRSTRGGGGKKPVPTMKQFLGLFQVGSERTAFTATQLVEECVKRGWDKGGCKRLRDEAVTANLLVASRGGHNKMSFALSGTSKG